MLSAATIAVLVAMALALFRALAGPTLFDRILAVNSIATNTMVLIALVGFLTQRPEFLDIALVYALINFIGTIAVLKYFEQGALHHPGLEHEDDKPQASDPPRGLS
jgi:multicomponent Na+:H+ antiporter subunit F